MKHVYRAYPSATKRVPGIASLAVGWSIIARGLSHDPRLQSGLLGVAFLAILAQGVRFIPGRVVVGADGMLVHWLWTRTFVRRAAIASIDAPNKARVRIVKKDGTATEVELTSAGALEPFLADVARLRESAAADVARPRRAATSDALAARVTAWARSRDGAAEPLPSSAAYRSGDSPEQLWDMAADVDAPALARIGAVHALGALDDDARVRVRELAEASADPLTSAALDAAAAGDEKQLRAIVTGRASGHFAPSALDAREDHHHDATTGATPALLHPNRAVLALAWLSRLWFLAPIVTLFGGPPTLAFASFIACAVGAMPWAAAREMDPLIRVVKGRVDVEYGCIMQGGEPILDLSTVTAAFIHHRSGAAPVVRLEGRLGWPLLDVRLESLAEARAFLRRLPLTEAQREARFGTMHPGAARFVAIILATLAALAFAVLTHMKSPQSMAMVGGLALASLRVRRLITVKRDGLLFRSAWNTRFIPFDEVATVERRQNAGVVVLRSGERVMLRSIAGELTSIADDDLTETVIQRLDERRAAQGLRTRVEVDVHARVGDATGQDDGNVTSEDDATGEEDDAAGEEDDAPKQRRA